MGLRPQNTICKIFAYLLLIGSVSAALLFSFSFVFTSPAHAAAGINQEMNFQGRLLNAQGATVADGYYNVEFKIYQDGDGQSAGNTTGSPTGTLEWTEAHLNVNSQGVMVKNGFMSVQLGSIVPFGSNVDWNQDKLWLSMNIASTNASCTPFSSCTPDGEMLPMKRLSASPYALNAQNANTLGGLTSAGFIQNTTTVQTNASIAIQSAADTNTTAFFQGRTNQSVPTLKLQNGSSQSGKFLEILNSGSGLVFDIDQFGNLQQTAKASIGAEMGVGVAATSGVQLLVTAGTGNIGLQAVGNGTQDILQLYNGATQVANVTATGAANFQNSTDSTAAFQVKQSTGAGGGSVLSVDTSNSNIALLGNNTNSLTTWTSTTAMSVGSAGAGQQRVRAGAIAANGYLYHIGGLDGFANELATVQYAKLNADGTVGTWASTTALPEARKQFQPVVVGNYIYVIGGRDNTNAVEGTSYYAKLNSDGTVGAWNTTTALNDGSAAFLFNHGAVSYNGYIYVMGGFDENVTTMSTVMYAKANPNGTLGAWSTTSALPEVLAGINGSTIANGYIYVAGGFDGSADEDDISRAKINADGTLGSWTAQAGVLNSSGGGDENLQLLVANGYLYVIGGEWANRVVAFPLNADGSVGSSTILTDLPVTPGEIAAAQANGYFYFLGGSDGTDGAGTARNSVYYAGTPRVKVGGGLDLVGYSGENLSEGRSGGTLTAGNTAIIGTLQVQDSANFVRDVSANGDIMASGSIGSATGFKVGASAGTSATCGAGEILQSAVVVGGITTGGSCAAFSNGVTTVGTFVDATSYTNGAQISGTTITFGAADGTNPGMVSTGTQTFAGNKTFTGNIVATTMTGATASMLTLQGGNATSGNTNGGNLVLSGGTGAGTGVGGLVVISTPTFSTTVNDANCYTGGALVAASCTIATASVNSSSAIVVGFNVIGQIATLPDPTITTPGRIVYIIGANGSSDFTLRVNSGGTGNDVAMRQNTSATMVWNGSDWTAAGASSSTTLQSAYDNTLQSAGGAELVVSKTSATNGLTIRDSLTNPVDGTLLGVQTSSAANLLSINSNVTEYASNAGAETPGASGSTFPANTWSAVSSTISRYTTAGNFIANGQASVEVVTSASANTGVANRLNTTLTANTLYNVSFAARLSSGTFTDMNVYYSIDGSAASVLCTTGAAVASSIQTKVNCAFKAPSSGITSSNAILIRQTGATARTFYVDNLSVTIAADYNYATDGSVDDNTNFSTNWPAVGSTVTRSTSIGNDASSSAQVVTTGANQGVRNLLSVNPLTSTVYRVTAYASSTTSGFNTFTVRYSRDGGTNFVGCADYNTQTISSVASEFTKVTCYITTDSTAATSPYVYFTQTDSTGRTFYVDTFSMTLSTKITPNVQIGGGTNGGPITLLTMDRAAAAPIASNNEQLLGSMYYDTTLGKLQCYESDGWGACGSSPDDLVTISPEYTNAVLHGTGVGTMTSDLCSDTLNINDGSSGQATICGTNETYNFYKWTSPQATAQTYSIFVTYQLPSTFKSFLSGQASVMGRTDSSNSSVSYQIYKQSTGTGLVSCGSSVSVSTGTQTSWQTGIASGASDPSTCGFLPGSSIVFKIDVVASSNANAYVGNLNFAFNNN